MNHLVRIKSKSQTSHTQTQTHFILTIILTTKKPMFKDVVLIF
jgi:hypothetical protein